MTDRPNKFNYDNGVTVVEQRLALPGSANHINLVHFNLCYYAPLRHNGVRACLLFTPTPHFKERVNVFQDV